MEFHQSDEVCHESLKAMKAAQDKKSINDTLAREAKRKREAEEEMNAKRDAEHPNKSSFFGPL